jgi:Tfp pilus assembly protein PilN
MGRCCRLGPPQGLLNIDLKRLIETRRPMKDIDFLPIRYRERSAQRRARFGRAVMVCCLTGFVVVVSLAQHAVRRSVDLELTAVNKDYAVAQSDSARVAEMKQDLAEIEAFASLYTYLGYPWPVTQILTRVAETLPDSVVISQMKLETVAIAPATPIATAPTPTGPPTTAMDAAQRDLDRLRSSQDGITFTLRISGVSSNVSELQSFVKRLAPSPLFKAAKLESLEAQRSDDRITRSRFELRVFVRAGFGQPGGPEKPMLESKTENTLARRASEGEL